MPFSQSLSRPLLLGHFNRRTAIGRSIAAILLVVGISGGFSAGMARAAEEEDDTKPQDINLKTGDGLDLKATFYPTTLEKKLRKDAVPIIVLHGWKGDRGDCEQIAADLQSQGHAVITPDLRGHGESLHLARPDGAKTDFDANRLRPADFRAMVDYDLEAIKTFLIAKNNEGQLNIERLGIIGAEMGAVVAINWAAKDWGWPVLATGKQGQDVKAIVAISPEWNFKGLALTAALQEQSVRSSIAMLIIGGKGNANIARDTKKLHQSLERFHDPENKELFLYMFDTKLQGMKLLNEKALSVDQKISNFIKLRLVQPKLPWEERKDPLK
jgi:pimeloyl-ACP methyl ester carboxylesterase